MASFVFFTAAAQTLAILAADAVQVLRMAAPTPVPGAPPFVRGLLNVHGAVLLVLDAGARLGAPAAPLRPGAHLLVASAGGRRLALAVDRVLGVREVDDAAVEVPPATAPQGLVAAAVRVDDGLVLVHRPAAWLAEAEAAGAAARG
jgi:purine-binding chemotaxis protein CheW